MNLTPDFMIGSPNSTERDDMSASPHNSMSAMPLPSQPAHSAADHLAIRRRKSAAKVIKRSASTPNVRRDAAGDAAALAEKRRNKLGYHRTSVACVHCRRRKIRCLLANDDVQNRCSNCIRLKKECNFFPVDQQPSHERRQYSTSKADAGSIHASNSSSSSPGAHHDSLDQVEHYRPYPPLINTSGFGTTIAPVGSSILSLAPHGGTYHRLRAYPADQEASLDSRTTDYSLSHDRSSWDGFSYDHAHSAGGYSAADEHASGFWKPVESPITPFSPYPSVSQRPEPNWPLPARSMSYGTLDDLPHTDQYNSQYRVESGRRASEMLPPSLMNSANSSAVSVSELSSQSMASPAITQPLYQYGLPQWSQFNAGPQVIKNADFATWYTEPGQLAKVQEEEIGHQFVHESTAIYAGAGHP